jgi:hypothetical protein
LSLSVISSAITQTTRESIRCESLTKQCIVTATIEIASRCALNVIISAFTNTKSVFFRSSLDLGNHGYHFAFFHFLNGPWFFCRYVQGRSLIRYYQTTHIKPQTLPDFDASCDRVAVQYDGNRDVLYPLMARPRFNFFT